MKFSTRARYGLRMMVELARIQQKEDLVHLGRIAQITGISNNYLAQLAMSLKNNGLLIGISGKKGGYQLAKPAQEIKINDIIEAVMGSVNITECVNHPEICLNSSFCEARMVWVLVNQRVQKVLNEHTLSELIDKDWVLKTRRENPDIALLDPDRFLAYAHANTPDSPGDPMTKSRGKRTGLNHNKSAYRQDKSLLSEHISRQIRTKKGNNRQEKGQKNDS
jgi:Rrf2 family protein